MINIANILLNSNKDVTLYDKVRRCNVHFNSVSNTGIIQCTLDSDRNVGIYYSKYGTLAGYEDGEVVLFPSKDNQSWDNYIPRKKGDILLLICTGITYVAIIDKETSNYYQVATALDIADDTLAFSIAIDKETILKVEEVDYNVKLALKETLQKKHLYWDSSNLQLKCTFKPFEQVLVRNLDCEEWTINFFSHYKDNRYVCACGDWLECIPYNDKLVGTKLSC